MGHIERTVFDRGVLKDLAATGVYLNLDLFGHESSFYPLGAETYMPCDYERVDMIDFLLSQGLCGPHSPGPRHLLQAPPEVLRRPRGGTTY